MRHASKRAIRASIHASAREATWDHGSGAGLFCQFQSTPPHGRRLFAAAFASFAQGVSIHASAREATCPCRSPQRRPGCFNPRLRTGGDRLSLSRTLLPNVSIHASAREATAPTTARVATNWMFQSTPPHGRRLYPTKLSFAFVGFNPRLRTGGDTLHIDRLGPYKQVSIHASAREATVTGVGLRG